MMAMGEDILKSLGTGTPLDLSNSNFPPELSRFIRESEKLDTVLNEWQHSDSFALALNHADVGTQLMRELVQRNKQFDIASRDTPFFGFCCCQIVVDVNVGSSEFNCCKTVGFIQV
jgi:hypothetical protein